MGSSCGKEVGATNVDIPEGILELKKQRQFTEHWKRKYDVSLNCFFTTIDRLSSKSVPALRGCTGVIVVRIAVTCKHPTRSNLNSVLHTPVLQWHGPDVKFQFPKFLPLNMWEGEHTVFAIYHTESSALMRGYCTVTAKIGQEEILLEEELQFGNAVSLAEVKTLSNEFERHIDKLPISIKKKHKKSSGRISQRESHDTGYTSEKTPYPALRYSEHDTDSDRDEEKERYKEKRSKLRRKDTPSCFGKTHVANVPKMAAIPLIEELEMNHGSSEEHSDEVEINDIAEQYSTLTNEELDDNARQGPEALTKAASTMAFPLSNSSLLEKSMKRSPISLVDDLQNVPVVDVVATDQTVAGSILSEKNVTRQQAKRKKKSITGRFAKEKVIPDKAEPDDEADVSLAQCSSAEDADDEDDQAIKAREQVQTDQQIHIEEEVDVEHASTKRQKVNREQADPNQESDVQQGGLNQQRVRWDLGVHVEAVEVQRDPETIDSSIRRKSPASVEPTPVKNDGDSLEIHIENMEEIQELIQLETIDESGSKYDEHDSGKSKQSSGVKSRNDNDVVCFIDTKELEEESADMFNCEMTDTIAGNVTHDVLASEDTAIASTIPGNTATFRSQISNQSSENRYTKAKTSKDNLPEEQRLISECDISQNSQGRGKSESFSCTARRLPSPMKHSLSSDLGSPRDKKAPEVVPPLSPKKSFL